MDMENISGNQYLHDCALCSKFIPKKIWIYCLCCFIPFSSLFPRSWSPPFPTAQDQCNRAQCPAQWPSPAPAPGGWIPRWRPGWWSRRRWPQLPPWRSTWPRPAPWSCRPRRGPHPCTARWTRWSKSCRCSWWLEKGRMMSFLALLKGQGSWKTQPKTTTVWICLEGVEVRLVNNWKPSSTPQKSSRHCDPSIVPSRLKE